MATALRLAAGSFFQSRLTRSLALLLLPGLYIGAAEPQLLGPVTIDFGKHSFTDLSGVGIVGKFMVVCDDEDHQFVHLLEAKDGAYKYVRRLQLADDEGELDLEGIASDENVVYVTGSHSRNKNNKRRKSREKVFRFELGPDRWIKGNVETTTLRKVIVNSPALDPASRKKPKEGGIDIEGLAFFDGWLYAGFRGPLDQGKALVLKFKFANPADAAQLLRMDLGGLGIRDMTRAKDAFLILAGPMDAAAAPYQLYEWNGKSGADSKTRKLCDIPTKAGAKAEGLAVLREDKMNYEFLVLYDGPTGGDPKRFRVKK